MFEKENNAYKKLQCDKNIKVINSFMIELNESCAENIPINAH